MEKKRGKRLIFHTWMMVFDDKGSLIKLIANQNIPKVLVSLKHGK